MSSNKRCRLELQDIQEINPLYEEEIELDGDVFELGKRDDLTNDLAEIKQLFAEILENEIKIQRDIRFIKRSRLKSEDMPPVEVVDKNPNQYFSSANSEFDLSKMNLPCSSLEDVHVLEKQLSSNVYFEIFFKNLLLEIESYDLTTFIKSAMQSIVNDDVTFNFSWHGIGDNIEIRTFKFMQILIEICIIKFNHTAKPLIKKGIQKYLSLVKEKIRRKARDEENESFWTKD